MLHGKKEKTKHIQNLRENALKTGQSKPRVLKPYSSDYPRVARKRKFVSATSQISFKKPKKKRKSNGADLKKEIDLLKKGDWKDIEKLANSKRVKGGSYLEIKTLKLIISSLIDEHKTNLVALKENTLNVKELNEARKSIEAHKLEIHKLTSKIKGMFSDEGYQGEVALDLAEEEDQLKNCLEKVLERANIAEKELLNLRIKCEKSTNELIQLKANSSPRTLTLDINQYSENVFETEDEDIILSRGGDIRFELVPEKAANIELSGQITTSWIPDKSNSLRVRGRNVTKSLETERENDDCTKSASVHSNHPGIRGEKSVNEPVLVTSDSDIRNLNVTSERLVDLSFFEKVSSLENEVISLRSSVKSVKEKMEQQINMACEAHDQFGKVSEERNKLKVEADRFKEKVDHLQKLYDTAVLHQSEYQAQLHNMKMWMEAERMDAEEVEGLRNQVAELVEIMGQTKRYAEEIAEDAKLYQSSSKDRSKLFTMEKSVETNILEADSKRVVLKKKWEKHALDQSDIGDLQDRMDAMLDENVGLKSKFKELEEALREIFSKSDCGSFSQSGENSNVKTELMPKISTNSHSSPKAIINRVKALERIILSVCSGFGNMKSGVKEMKAVLAKFCDERNEYGGELQHLIAKLESTESQCSAWRKRLQETVPVQEFENPNWDDAGKTQPNLMDQTEILEERVVPEEEFNKRAAKTETTMRNQTAGRISGSTSNKYQIAIEKEEADRMQPEKVKQKPGVKVWNRIRDGGGIPTEPLTREAAFPASAVGSTANFGSVDDEISRILELTLNVSKKLAKMNMDLSRKAPPAGGGGMTGAKERISEMEQMLGQQAKMIFNLRNISAEIKPSERSKVAQQNGYDNAHHISRMQQKNRRTVISTASIISIGVLSPVKEVQNDIPRPLTPKTLEMSNLSEKLERALKGKFKVAKRATNWIIYLENAQRKLREEIKYLKRQGIGLPSKADQ